MIRDDGLQTRAALALCVGLACAMSVAGCSRVDPDQEAIAKARTAMARVSVAGAALFPDVGRRRAAYQDVLKELKAVSERAEAGEQTAAQSLAARAHAGLAEIAAQDAAAAESVFTNDLTVARAVLAQWIGQNSVADALASYNPTDDLAAVDAEIAQRLFEIRNTEIARAEVQRKIAALQSEVREAQEEATRIRDEDARVLAELGDVSQTARAAALEASVERRRAADASERRAATVLAEIQALRPQVDEHDAQAQRLVRQADLLRESKAGITKRAEDSRTQASIARGEAADVGKRLDGLLNALISARQNADAPTEQATRAFAQAVAAAKKARSTAPREGQPGLSAAAGAYEHARADAFATRARSLTGLARLMGDAALASPPLPNANAYTDKAQSLATSAEAATKEAIESYRSARTLFKGVTGGGPDAQSHLKAIDEALRSLGSEAEEPAETPEPDPAEPAAPAEEPAPAENPEG